MSAQIDVLAVMGQCANVATFNSQRYGDPTLKQHAEEANAARAAVAELIEAGAAYAEIGSSSDNWSGDEQRYFAQMAGAETDSSRWVVIQMAQSRFESALARVKGA